MELTVLGSSASVPAPGDACSGYLVRQDDAEILLDCGNGVLANLLSETSLPRLSAIVISHFHPDHYLDLVPMRYALRYGGLSCRPHLLVPPGGKTYLAKLGLALRDKADFFEASFDLAEYDPDAVMDIDGLRLSFQRTTHDEPTWAFKVQGEATLAYTADTQWSDDLVRFAKGADLLLAEATFPGYVPADQTANHLRAPEAGALARAAGVERLLLTHAWPGYDREEMRREAAAVYDGEVEAARAVYRFSVGTPARTVTP
jgi:ribonuclease BN (tRNA processing enzyme)